MGAQISQCEIRDPITEDKGVETSASSFFFVGFLAGNEEERKIKKIYEIFRKNLTKILA